MTRRMRLFQYWDTGDPPSEVRRWIKETRNLNPELEHCLFSEETATAFIRERHGERRARAFGRCAVPAMQADYFRLCAIAACGGVYMDADQQAMAPLSTATAGAAEGMMLVWRNRLINGFMMFRAPGNPFVEACLALATDNVESRRFQSVHQVAGPAVVNAVWALAAPPGEARDPDDALFIGPPNPAMLARARELVPPTPELVRARGEITLVHVLAASDWLGTQRPSYKDTSRHWVTWKGPIFRDAG